MGVGKGAASLGQTCIYLVKLNSAIKGLTIKAIYPLKKKYLFQHHLLSNIYP